MALLCPICKSPAQELDRTGDATGFYCWGQHHPFEGAKHDCVTRLDRDRAAGVNHAWNSRHRCRDTSPAVPMAYA